MSNLSFISKVIEKVVASRILDHMKENTCWILCNRLTDQDIVQNCLAQGPQWYCMCHWQRARSLSYSSRFISSFWHGWPRDLSFILERLCWSRWSSSQSLWNLYCRQNSVCFPSMVYCLNLVNWCSAYSGICSWTDRILYLYNSTWSNSSILQDSVSYLLLMILSSIALLIYIHLMKLFHHFGLYFGHKNLDDSEQTKDKWWQNRISSSYILKSKFHR